MADLDPVTQAFVADVTEYLSAMDEAAADAQAFAAANVEAKAAVDGVRDSSAEAALSVSEMRGRLAEVAAAAGITRDEMGKLHDAQGKIVADSVLTGLALGHERDEALEAAAAYKKLRDAVAEADIAKSGGGLLSKLGGLAGGGGGGGGALSAIPLLGPLIEAPELLLAIVPAVMAVATEVGALASGFAAAGLGVGSFALLALPTLKEVFGAVGDTKAQLDKLPQPIRLAVTEVKNVKAQFEGMAKAFQLPTVQVFSQAIGILSDHMGLIKTFADATLPAVEKVLGMLSKGLDSTTFKDFIGYMSKLSGPAIEAIGSGMAGLAKDVMHLLTVMSQKDVINGINIAFRLVGAAISTLIWIIQASMKTWDWITQTALPAVRDAFDTTRHAIATAGHDIASAFDTVRHAIATAGHDIASAFDTARHAVATAGHDIASAFDTARHAVATAGHDIKAALEAVVNWVSSHWKEILAWLVDPIGMAVFEIRTHLHEIAQTFDQMRHDVAAILAGARHDIAAAFDGARHDIAAAWDGARHDTAAALDGARHDIASAWDGARHDVAAAVDAIPGEIEKAWDTVRHDAAAAFDAVLKSIEDAWKSITGTTQKGASDVGGFFQKLPGQIISFLAALPGQMLSIGENVVLGLLHGIENQAQQLLNVAKSLASDVEKAFTDPLAILSPSRVMYGHGADYVNGIIEGVRSRASALKDSVGALAAGIGAQGIGAAGAAGGGQAHNFNVSVHAQGAAPGLYQGPQFEQYMQRQVQEAILRYGQLNPTNGLTPAWGR